MTVPLHPAAEEYCQSRFQSGGYARPQSWPSDPTSPYTSEEEESFHAPEIWDYSGNYTPERNWTETRTVYHPSEYPDGMSAAEWNKVRSDNTRIIAGFEYMWLRANHPDLLPWHQPSVKVPQIEPSFIPLRDLTDIRLKNDDKSNDNSDALAGCGCCMVPLLAIVAGMMYSAGYVLDWELAGWIALYITAALMLLGILIPIIRIMIDWRKRVRGRREHMTQCAQHRMEFETQLDKIREENQRLLAIVIEEMHGHLSGVGWRGFLPAQQPNSDK